jgi:hypothetical protein
MTSAQLGTQSQNSSAVWGLVACLTLWLAVASGGWAAVTELNSSGGTSATNGLRFFLENTTKLQVRRLNNTGQVYHPSAVPPSNSLDNGIFLRANGRLFGPSHTVGDTFSPSGGMYNTFSISAATPPNPVTAGTVQSASQSFGITAGPQVSIHWRYTSPYDFIIADVTVVIPAGYAVSASNPVRYYHVVDTFLGGSDWGCGVSYLDGNGKRTVGTYPPPSGTTCPSTTAVPATVSVVQSFRERSGLPFSHYCTSTWNAFYRSDSTNCFLMQAAPFSNFISNTYRDTGIGIEYDFTAPGTYTFSYDFVIGSPSVPAYDHLELQHDGSGTLCPASVTVLGCLSSQVPCPAGSIHNAVLSGTLTPSAGTPLVTWTPPGFAIASGALQQTVSFQAAAPGGTVVLGATGLSQIPLNGVRCWNRGAGLASCGYTVVNVSCHADALDACSVLAPNRCAATGNRLFTQVSGQPMSFDLVALKTGVSPIAVDTGFVSAAANPVTVDLVASASGSVDASKCPTTPVTVPGISAQVIPFSAGRPPLPTSFTIPALQNLAAYRHVWVRFNQGGGRVNCSSDRFSIRPAAYGAVGSGAANADSAGGGSSALPVIKTGTAFDLVTDTGVPGYDDLPKIDGNQLDWSNAPVGGRAAPGVGVLSGAFSVPANPVTGNGASGMSFTYDEVGYFRFLAHGVYDNTFTSYSGDQGGGDCIDTAPNDFSNTPVNGRYGCKFGNPSPTRYFGRFIPDRLMLSGASLINRKDLSCAGSVFSYLGEPMRVDFTLTAVNAGNQTTRNYSGSFARLEASSQAAWLAGNPGLGLTAMDGATNLTSRLTVSPSGNWSGGVAAYTADLALARVSTPDGPFESLNLSIKPQDSDGVTMNAAPLGLTKARFGRLRLANAYGSELLRLPVPVSAEYFSDASGFVPNADDACTTLALTPGVDNSPADYRWGDTTLANASQAMTVAATRPVSSGPLTMAGGKGSLLMAPPGTGGGLDLTATVPNWLQFDWNGDGIHTDNPSARLVFGIFKSNLIDLRERY